MRLPERIETARLALRRLEPGDREAFLAVWADPDVWAALRPTGEPYDETIAADGFDRHTAHWEEYGFGLYVIARDGEVIGWTGPNHPVIAPDMGHEIELGWTLRRAHWGAGLATEAARTAGAAAFEALRPPRLISLIHPTNTRSQAVARRLGMREAERTVHRSIGLPLSIWAIERERWRVADPKRRS